MDNLMKRYLKNNMKKIFLKHWTIQQKQTQISVIPITVYEPEADSWGGGESEFQSISFFQVSSDSRGKFFIDFSQSSSSVS